ncbi:HAD family hydrolase [Corynebacterium aquatimens]|uniref:Hydroxymethylpyrimidine pyrophosphatase-like HAD family hydrolase n=1 Tax=Corynebacterium aquatimens TaxID=1190508 RepID=A0A931GTB2_9CORY|nr:HAD family hydrolase [Corynebacterium aquatimens]MBG6122832.1 hydroxymethylpyrimidine pyrophosphatase-like HAD family hydrolase [Corynebacterium aquatimens]WJY66833.1 Sugar phosphatase YidA [Corynebacterium aquatimens]
MSTGAPKLIVSDIDGTFLNSTNRVTPRLRDVIMRAVRSGAKFGLATGRPHRWLTPVLDQLPISPICVCANGAVLYDPSSDSILARHELEPDVMADIVSAVASAMPSGIGWGVERVGSSALDPEDECFLITQDYNPDLWDIGYGKVTIRELVSVPAAKLLVRHPTMNSAEMFDIIAPLVDADDAHVTYSMDEGLIEIAAPGITKATGVSTLAAHYGLTAADTITFGDMPNDVEMLAWAGLGVAMGNAAPIVHDAADYITGDNDSDGVAQVLERWF